MALSPEYGWPEPDNSSLVKNGAQDIRALGDAIDTSVWNVGYGQAAKNKIINGDFKINQRAFTSTTTSATYGFDRFFFGTSDGTVTYSAQTFTAGAAPVAGYEATNFAQIVTTGQTLTTAATNLQQRIESVRTFAGQTATFSFWAKANTGTPNVIVSLVQNFGTGGSPSASVTTNGTVQAITTSWARYSFTIAVPSISGKTIGTSTDGFLSPNIYVSGGSASAVPTVGIQSNTFQIWGVQAEYGSKATPFQTATGTIQGELAACQRYYWRNTVGTAYGVHGLAYGVSATSAYGLVHFPIAMRAIPTSIDFSNIAIDSSGVFANAVSAITGGQATNLNGGATYTTTGLTAGVTYDIANNNNVNGYLGYSAEL
jgi:hypothetical protein